MKTNAIHPPTIIIYILFFSLTILAIDELFKKENIVGGYLLSLHIFYLYLISHEEEILNQIKKDKTSKKKGFNDKTTNKKRNQDTIT